MNKTSFSEKCRILGDLWLYYRNDIETSPEWQDFFGYNDISLPSAYMIASDILIPSGDSRVEQFIDETWEMFCEYIEIDPDGWYQSLDEAFGASSRPPLNNE